MKKKLTNTRVINSIGIGILAAITAGTPVLAALNNSLGEDNASEPMNASEAPAEPVEAAAASQNGEIINTISEAQATIQEVRDELNQISGGNVDDSEVTGGENGTPSEEGDITEAPQIPAEPEVPSEGTDPVDESQPSGDGEAQPEGTDGQTPPEEVGSENPETPGEVVDPETPETPGENIDPETPETPPETVDPEAPVTPPEEGGDTEIVDTPQTPEGSETNASRIDEALEKTQNALENIKNDELVVELDKKNEEARDAIDNFNETVENPNNFIGSIVNIVSGASSAVVDAAASVREDEKIAKDQAQAAIDAQLKVYDSREDAAAAQQEAQEAAAAAEAAYNSALVTVEEAENNKAVADERLTDLERQLAEADAALSDMQIKVQEAQEALLAVLEQYGLKPGEFNPEDLKGDVLEAYTNVQNAVNIAQQELDDALKAYEQINRQVEAATNSYNDAAIALGESNKEMEKAASNLESKINEWKAAQVDEKIAKYNEGLNGTQKVYIEVAAAEKALSDAKDALKSAQNVKEKADKVLDNAEAAVEAAKKEEIETAQEAAAAAIEAANAIKENPEEVENAKIAAEAAVQSARAAAEQVQRDLVCLDAADKNAQQAQKDLDEAKKAVDEATEARDEAQERYNNLLAEWDQSKKEAMEKQIEAVQELLNKEDDLKSALGTAKYALATKLLVFQLLYEDKEFTEIKAGGKNEIIVVGSDGVETKYYFFTPNGKMEVFLYDGGTKAYINEEIFKESVKEFQAGESDLKSAEDELQKLEEELTKAEEAKDKADLINVLVNMKATFRTVQQEAENLVQVEQPFEEKNDENSLLDILSASLKNLIAGGEKYEKAKDTLEDVTLANTAVEETLQQLVDFSIQGNWNQEEYEQLKAAYNAAKADRDVAAEALEKCVEGLNSAKTEKDRARIAANAVFSYITDGNVRPTTPADPSTPSQPGTTDPTTPSQPGTTDTTTPSQPGTTEPSTPSQPGTTTPVQPVTPVEPVYGTLIETVTTPIIADRGVSSEAGNTGYTTLGGQTAYTAPAAEPEAEPAERELVSVEDEEVPLAEVDASTATKNNTNSATRKVSDEKVPLADIETENNKISWWWILVIALLGATGTELYIRHKNKEDEKKEKGAKQNFVKI